MISKFYFNFLNLCLILPTDAEMAEYSYSMNNNKSHEAGYDAHITGLAFITLTSYLGQYSKNIYHLEKLPICKNIVV